ncbi:hypothetical protein KW791_03370 [Candidatus Parcubacteria bacterium]|nr:hypothetical protein [Candidatus Parcubacteria bacterium]
MGDKIEYHDFFGGVIRYVPGTGMLMSSNEFSRLVKFGSQLAWQPGVSHMARFSPEMDEAAAREKARELAGPEFPQAELDKLFPN